LGLLRAALQLGDRVEVVTRADVRFHAVLSESCGNPALAALVDTLNSRTLQARVWRGYAEVGVWDRTLAEHQAIYDALRDRDPARAATCAASHVASVESFFRRAGRAEGGSPAEGGAPAGGAPA
ncbi:MAG: FadR/GntR family transcriptional regulator, partial [Actinomycetes bacterium]